MLRVAASWYEIYNIYIHIIYIGTLILHWRAVSQKCREICKKCHLLQQLMAWKKNVIKITIYKYIEKLKIVYDVISRKENV